MFFNCQSPGILAGNQGKTSCKVLIQATQKFFKNTKAVENQIFIQILKYTSTSNSRPRIDPIPNLNITKDTPHYPVYGKTSNHTKALKRHLKNRIFDP